MAADVQDKSGWDLVTVNIDKVFKPLDIAAATIVSEGDGQRNMIRALTGINVSCRQRNGWHCKQLTMSGPPEADFPEAKRLALLAIAHNFAAGITKEQSNADGNKLLKTSSKARQPGQPKKSALPPRLEKQPQLPWAAINAQSIHQQNQMYRTPPQEQKVG
jgi:hypothetical protein